MLSIRDVRPEDARLLWEWTSDPAVRRASFRSDPIPWSAHLAWFGARLADPRARLYLLLDGDGSPVGMVRFHLGEVGRPVAIGVTVAPESRGRGYGAEGIRLACATLRATERGEVEVEALIKPENLASRRAFARAGFREEGECLVDGQPAFRMSWSG